MTHKTSILPLFKKNFRLDWIGLTVGYWCFHYSKDCSRAKNPSYHALREVGWDGYSFQGNQCRKSTKVLIYESVTRVTLLGTG